MTRTLVVQSFRDRDVPLWIRRCLDSVKAWASLAGYDYRLVGDECFALCGPEYLERAGGNKRTIANLARLELVKAAHLEGYDLVAWLDADVLVFRPEALRIDEVVRYAFARETWVFWDGGTAWRAFSAVNNSAFVCRRGDADLDFLIVATRHVVLHRAISGNYQVGGDLIKGLRASLAFETLGEIGMFSNYLVRAIARDVSGLQSVQARLHGNPVYAANLCASENYEPRVTESEVARAIDALLHTEGDVINRWLTDAPGLRLGEGSNFDSAEFTQRIFGKAGL
jgi:hypothetical protein